MLLIESRNDNLDNDFASLLAIAKIAATMKIMLVYRLGSRQSVRTNREFDRLKYSRLSNIVVAQQHRSPI